MRKRYRPSERTLDLIGITLVAFIPILLLRPFQNAPYVDDWVYAWSVEWLLKHHELRILEFSASINVVQTLWGALFCLPFGFSFTALRVSTWVLSVFGLWGLYLTLRELEVSRRDSVLGTAVLAVYPVYFLLSFTYMTDVPFVTTIVWFFCALTRAVRRQSDRWLAASSLLACAAIGVRVPGVILPCVIAAVLMFHGGKWRSSPIRYVWVILPLLFCGAMLWWFQGHSFRSADLTYVNGAPANKLKQIRLYGLQAFPSMLVVDLNFLSGTLGLALLPFLSAVKKADLVRVAVIAAVLAGALWLQVNQEIKYVPPLTEGQVWSVNELGATQEEVSGYTQLSFEFLRHWTWIAATMILGSFALAGLFRFSRTGGEAGIRWFSLGYFLTVAMLWLFYDRYGMVFVPPAIVLVLAARPMQRQAVAWLLVAALGAISLIGTRDHLEYNRTLWAAVDYLRRNGAPDSEIGGSYMINGWLQFAHPENGTIRGNNGELEIPWVTTKARLRYEISNAAAPGNLVIKTLPYTQWVGRPGSIYILDQLPSGQR